MRDLHVSERSFGGGTRRIVVVSELEPMAASARFLARQEDALQRAEEAHDIEDIDERLVALERAIRDWLGA